ncbi:hypothetical protein BX260_3127 [Streptomyces sp. 5112.2]|nr:hypothetical protein BX260_3127 [Streptomyces sp. 5112.2]
MEGPDDRRPVLLAPPTGREQGLEQGLEQGHIQTRREMTLRILERRAIPAPDAVRERVETCTDLDQLDTWARRAVHATDATELFTEQ